MEDARDGYQSQLTSLVATSDAGFGQTVGRLQGRIAAYTELLELPGYLAAQLDAVEAHRETPSRPRRDLGTDH